jgi:hypothetical protein
VQLVVQQLALVELLVEQQLAQLEELVEQLVVQVQLQVLRVEMQLVLKLLLAKILELVECHLLVHQRQVLSLLQLLLKLKLLVSMF